MVETFLWPLNLLVFSWKYALTLASSCRVCGYVEGYLRLDLCTLP